MSIALNNVHYIYDASTVFETEALHSINLAIRDGDIVAIMGRTGSGKSTLLQMIAGLCEPTEGEILIDGENINESAYDRKELRSKVGIVFQFPEMQLFETTVYKDVAFGLKHSGLAKDVIEHRVRWALEKTGFDFEKVAQESPLSFSGGEKRRLAIAGVLATRPQYLLLDEPFAGLDPMARNGFMDFLRELNAEGTTIVIASHNADCVAEIADRIAIISEGRILIEDERSNVFSRHELLAAAGVGSSRCSYIAAELGLQAVSFDELVAAVLEQRATEPKAEELVSEPVLVPKTELDPKAELEPKSAPKTEPKSEPKTELVSEAPAAQPKTEPKTEPKAEPKTEPKAKEQVSEPALEVRAGGGSDE